MAKFEVQARVVDLLGMQQIADCPTAISELFKNAYDAYARQVMLDVYPEDDQAVLWDDGVGMTEDELLHRWLVVGTAGKKELRSSLDPPEGMEPRPIQGEKGIGRLAIATLGDTLLLISRSIRPRSDPFVALLINWNLVRNERLLLSEIEIPTITFSDLEELETGIVADMVEDLRGVVRTTQRAWVGGNEQLRERILHQLDTFSVDLAILRRLAPSQSENGTIFYIRNLVDDFPEYVERPRRDEGREGHRNVLLVQLLSNFRKTFEHEPRSTQRSEPDFRADVRRFEPETHQLRSFFEENDAIGPEDLRSSDHSMDIEFDEHGRYYGTLEIYGKPVDLPPRERQPKQALSCGPFHLHLWYFQGRPYESILESDQWALIDKKLPFFGGVMIYRDNLRVLPYGTPEVDWLRFEERRSKRASRYFFSYRRMFGYVDITRRDNPRLVDKAGREGLIKNAAYHQLRERLADFFSEIALRHFRRGSPFDSRKQELKEREKQLNRERKRVQERREELRGETRKKLDHIVQHDPEQLELFLEERLQELERVDRPGAPEIADAIVRFEDRLAQMEGQGRLSVPRDLSLGRDQELKQLIADHRTSLDTFYVACHEIRRKFQEEVRERWPDAESAVDRKRALDNACKQAKSKIGIENKELIDRFEAEASELRIQLEDLYQQQLDRVDEALMAATSTSSVAEASTAAAENLTEILGAMDKAAAEGKAVLAEHRNRLGDYLHGYFGASRGELLAAQSDEIEEIRDQVDRNLELVQLGLSVEIIDHDLNRLYRGIKTNLSRLRNMVRNAPNSSRLVEELRGSFQHLEQRYKLMSPLYRGSYRLKSQIDGVRILTYCKNFLDGLLRSVGVELEATEAFRAYAIEEVPAVVLPVFVNMVDNAVYWLRDRDERRVVLDLRGEVITVCDTGPGIHPTLFDEIFEPFVSTKPGGRGLGLYIAHANLTRYHHAIWATDDPVYRKLSGACLCIRFHEDVVLSEK